MRSRFGPALCGPIFLFSLAAAGLSSGQDVPPQEIPLRVKNAIAISGEAAGILMMPLKCDSKGNVFVRGYQQGDILGAPVVKFSSDGKRLATFTLRAVPGFEKVGDALNFDVASRGEIFMLVTKSETERGLIRFHEDGKFDKYVALDTSFEPSHVASFSTGELLITGLRFPKDKPEARGEPFTALFDRSGKYLSEVRLDGDVEFAEEKNEANPNPPTVDKKQEQAKVLDIRDEEDLYSPISLGTMFSADDGNVYLMRAGKAPLVYVVTAGGESKRLSLPSAPGNFRLLTIKIAGGRAVLEYEENIAASRERPTSPKKLLSLVDLATGNRLLHYVVPAGAGAFACYAPGSLTFLGSGQNQTLTLKTLAP